MLDEDLSDGCERSESPTVKSVCVKTVLHFLVVRHRDKYNCGKSKC
jgi:hypothetical protein